MTMDLLQILTTVRHMMPHVEGWLKDITYGKKQLSKAVAQAQIDLGQLKTMLEVDETHTKDVKRKKSKNADDKEEEHVSLVERDKTVVSAVYLGRVGVLSVSEKKFTPI